MRQVGCARLVRNGLVVGLVVVLLTACDREEPSRGTATPVASTPAAAAPPTPATLSPAVTGEVTPTPAPTVTPLVVPTPLPTATAEVERTPTATPSPTAATPSPSATPAIEYTELTLGEPRTLPADMAFFYRVGWCGACNACGMGFGDIRRVVFDAATGEYREDRPAPESGHIDDYWVNLGGRGMAAMVCHAGSCNSWYDAPSPDAKQHLWVSRDGANTWEDLGPTLPAATIVAVTVDDILIEERNFWGERRWYNVTDQEWEDLLTRLGDLGLDDPEGWPHESSRLRWAVSGNPATASEVEATLAGQGHWVEGWPTWRETPGLRGLSWWSNDAVPHGGRIWTGFGSGGRLHATVDEQGVLRHVWDATGLDAVSDYEYPFVVSETLVVYDRVTCGGEVAQTSEAWLVDLETGSAHELAGLSLPMAGGGQGEGPLLYTLWRVVPLATE